MRSITLCGTFWGALWGVALGTLLSTGCGQSTGAGDGAAALDLTSSVVEMPMEGAPDLTTLSNEMSAIPDLILIRDLAPPDLVGASDFATPPDLVPPRDIALPPCSARCQFGCCTGEVCTVPGPSVGCASGGGACVACAPGTANACVNGNCSCGNSGQPCGKGLECAGGFCQCTAKSCANGCCANNVCIANPTASQCGTGGAACLDCAPQGDSCVAGACQCKGGAPCGTHSLCDPMKGCLCDQFSCGAGGMCSAITLTSCGLPGGACMTCNPHTASACDLKTGTCVCGAAPACGPGYFCDTSGLPVCKCDPTPKVGCSGCCSGNGMTCVVMTSDLQCGLGGSSCQNCAAGGATCNLAAGSCLGCSVTCTGMNNGCCVGNYCNLAANQDPLFGCGQNGNACSTCGIGADRCVAGNCSCGQGGMACAAGLECVKGVCQCDAKACPNGCCANNVCQTISVANCSLTGGVCSTCDAKVADACVNGACSCGNSGFACFPGQRCTNGSCVCDAQSCTKGCCGGNVCLTLGLSSCAVAGGACMTCDANLADTCANGMCLCGANPACGAGLLCVSGQCRCATDPCLTCATAAASKSYIGCDYWPTVTSNPAWSIFDFAVAVANPQAGAATVTVTGPGNFSSTTVVPAGQLAKIYLPWVASLKGPDMNSCGGIFPLLQTVVATASAYHLSSTLPVSVYQFNAMEYKGVGGPNGKSWNNCPGTVLDCNGFGPIGCYSFTNDASILLPSTAMTGSYRITGMHGWTYNGQKVLGGFFTVVGTQANTAVSVKIVTGGNVVAGGGIGAVAGGGLLTFNVNAGDVVQVMGGAGAAVDLSGSLLTANKPVEVITGVQCIDNPGNAPACDHIEESNFPAETFGKNYIVTQPTGPLGAPVGQTVRFYGNFNNTNLTYKPPINGAPATLQGGQVVELPNVTQDFLVSGDQSFAVGVVQQGASIVDPNTNPPNQQGDPAQSLAVAVEQYRTKYIFLAPSDYNVNYADIVTPTGTTLTLDGIAVVNAQVAIGASGYSVVRVKLGAGNLGAHTLTASAPSGLQVMGYGSYTSYQYPGGLDLTSISTTPKDTL